MEHGLLLALDLLLGQHRLLLRMLMLLVRLFRAFFVLLPLIQSTQKHADFVVIGACLALEEADGPGVRGYSSRALQRVNTYHLLVVLEGCSLECFTPVFCILYHSEKKNEINNCPMYVGGYLSLRENQRC